jgi:competence protein ComEC
MSLLMCMSLGSVILASAAAPAEKPTPGIQSITGITTVMTFGQKVTAIAVEYPANVKPEPIEDPENLDTYTVLDSWYDFRFDTGRRVIEPVLWARGVRRLSRLVLTHGDADHAGGAPAVVHDLPPPEVWEGVAVPPDPLLTGIRRTADAAGSVWRAVQRGDVAWLGGVSVTVWHPAAADWERQRVRNDDSVVLELRLGDVSIVLPGDIEAAAEAAVAGLLPAAPIRILQAPHHGSATSSSIGLIRAARPRLAVVSAGRGNRYGHPHRAVLERYRTEGVPVMRTDLEGAITLRTDGRSVRLESFTGTRVVLGPSTGGNRAPPP